MLIRLASKLIACKCVFGHVIFFIKHEIINYYYYYNPVY